MCTLCQKLNSVAVTLWSTMSKMGMAISLKMCLGNRIIPLLIHSLLLCISTSKKAQQTEAHAQRPGNQSCIPRSHKLALEICLLKVFFSPNHMAHAYLNFHINNHTQRLKEKKTTCMSVCSPLTYRISLVYFSIFHRNRTQKK